MAVVFLKGHGQTYQFSISTDTYEFLSTAEFCVTLLNSNCSQTPCKINPHPLYLLSV